MISITKLSIKAQIYAAFGILVFVLILLCWFVRTYQLQMVEDIQLMGKLELLEATIRTVRQHEKNFIMRRDESYALEVRKYLNKLKEYISTMGTENSGKYKEIEANIDKYSESFERYVELDKKQSLADEAMVKAARAVEASARNLYDKSLKMYQEHVRQNVTQELLNVELKGMEDSRNIIEWLLQARRYEKNFIIRKDDGYVKKVLEYIKMIEDTSQNMRRYLVDSGQKQLALNIIENAKEYKKAFVGIATDLDTLDSVTKTYKENFNSTVDILKEQWALEDFFIKYARNLENLILGVKDEGKQRIYDEITNLKRTTVIIMVGAIILAVFLGVILSMALVKNLRNAITKIRNISEQVSTASKEVAEASLSLAEGSSEQASSLEESASALEEISSMVKKNASNTEEVNSLMQHTVQVVKEAESAMEDLNVNVRKVMSVSEDISKIIKTIDEISFQTNILALNAAVEAARAGEAGAGFAVVADEVRSLALKTSMAAKDTEKLLSSTSSNLKNVLTLVANATNAFKLVADKSKEVEMLLREITIASKEQAEGIEQLNKAILEMEKVTQQNAANSEQGSAASEELKSQAEEMLGIVTELGRLLGQRDEKGRLNLLPVVVKNATA